MEFTDFLFLILLLLVPYVIVFLVTYWAAGHVTRPIISRYATRIERFLLAFSVFAIAEFFIRKGIFLLISIVIPSIGALGVIVFLVGPTMFWILNGLLLSVAIFFATMKSRVSTVPSIDAWWTRPLLVVLLIGALGVIMVPKLWRYIGPMLF